MTRHNVTYYLILTIAITKNDTNSKTDCKSIEHKERLKLYVLLFAILGIALIGN